MRIFWMAIDLPPIRLVDAVTGLTTGASPVASRVRRPIDGLVRDNYPPGPAATYHFIPKQTTDLLYRMSQDKSRGFPHLFQEIFKFFCFLLPQKALFPQV